MPTPDADPRVAAVNVTMLLADSAQVADGKLYILGGGWSLTVPDPSPSAVAIKLEVGWNETGREHHWELFLEDADGAPVMIQTPEGMQPVEIRGDLTVASSRARLSTCPWPSTWVPWRSPGGPASPGAC